MELELIIAILILMLLTFLATIDMAFSQLSDISLRKVSSDSEGNLKVKSIAFFAGYFGKSSAFSLCALDRYPDSTDQFYGFNNRCNFAFLCRAF
jgi:hypothetical protein